VHERLFPELPAAWRDETLAEKWAVLRRLRRVVTGALEVERAAKRIGSSLQAHAVIHADRASRDSAAGIDLAELCITSGIEFADGSAPEDAFRLPDVPGIAVRIIRAAGDKCERCWQVLPEVGRHPVHSALCHRCVDAVERHAAAAE
jgi:isoleucyl-tRNA synthetase